MALREAISYGMTVLARNLPSYAGMFDEYLLPIYSDLNKVTRKYKIPYDLNTTSFAFEHHKVYKLLLDKIDTSNYNEKTKELK